MWFYSTYFLYCYLLLFDGIPFATTTLAHPNPKDTPKTHISVNPKDLWNELKEVTEGSIDTATRDNEPQNICSNQHLSSTQAMVCYLNT